MLLYQWFSCALGTTADWELAWRGAEWHACAREKHCGPGAPRGACARAQEKQMAQEKQIHLRTKKIKVTVDPEQFSFAEGFGRLSPVVVLPDSISLVGPKSILAQIPSLIQVEIDEENISSNFGRDVEVKLPVGDGVVKNPASVEVIFEVVEWIPVTKKVKLKIENPPTRARLSLVMDSVNCTFQIPRSQLEDFEETIASQEAVIDLTNVRRGDRKLKPTITGLPSNARLVQIDSVAIRLY